MKKRVFNSRAKPIFIFMLVLAMTFFMCSSVFAADYNIDEDEPLSLTVVAEVSGITLSGAEITIYKVADGAPAYTSIIGDYDYEGITSDESHEIAAELAKTADSKADIKYTAITDENGEVTFKDLTMGIYLVVLSQEYVLNNTQYTFDPYLVCVPLGEETDNGYEWIYSVVSYPKTSKAIETSGSTASDDDDTATGSTASDDDDTATGSTASDDDDTATDSTILDDEDTTSGNASTSSAADDTASSVSSSVSSPQTGDTSNIAAWTASAMAAFCLALILIIKRKKENKNEET